MREGVNNYIPGNCNLGTEEIKRRFRIGYIGLALSVILITGMYVFGVPHTWRLLLFIPFFYSLSGFIQARNKFCYFYGLRNVFSLQGLRSFTRITNPEFRSKDRKKAILIIIVTFLISALLTLFFYFFH